MTKIPLSELQALLNKMGKMYRDWPIDKRQATIAAVLGCTSWQEALEVCGSCDEIPPRNSALSHCERAERYERMALDAAPLLGWDVPNAYEFVYWLRPFGQWGSKEDDVSWLSGKIVDRVTVMDEGLWWAYGQQEAHPLVPLGFGVHKAERGCRGAESRIGNSGAVVGQGEGALETLWVLVPEDHSLPHKTARNLFRRGAFVEVDPVPFDGCLYGSRAAAEVQLREYMAQHYRLKSAAERAELVRSWIEAIKTMRVMGGLPRSSRQRNAKPTLAARRRAGVTWYWPLTLSGHQADAEAKGMQKAERVDAKLIAEFGRDPGWMTDYPQR